MACSGGGEGSGPHSNFHGSVTVGERGQVVIPAAVRRELNIESGERLLVFRHPFDGAIVLSKIDAFADFLNQNLLLLERARQDIDSGEGDDESAEPSEE